MQDRWFDLVTVLISPVSFSIDAFMATLLVSWTAQNQWNKFQKIGFVVAPGARAGSIHGRLNVTMECRLHIGIHYSADG
jgi:hypothetical protein